MSESIVVPRKKYIRAAELPELKVYEGKTFITSKNGVTKAVKLVEVKRSKVYLKHTGDREDSFSIPLNKFREYYELPASSLLQHKVPVIESDTEVSN